MQDDIRAFMPYPAHPVPHAHGGPLSGMTFAVKICSTWRATRPAAAIRICWRSRGLKPHRAGRAEAAG